VFRTLFAIYFLILLHNLHAKYCPFLAGSANGACRPGGVQQLWLRVRQLHQLPAVPGRRAAAVQRDNDLRGRFQVQHGVGLDLRQHLPGARVRVPSAGTFLGPTGLQGLLHLFAQQCDRRLPQAPLPLPQRLQF
jgi:hypothetical protein